MSYRIVYQTNPYRQKNQVSKQKIIPGRWRIEERSCTKIRKFNYDNMKKSRCDKNKSNKTKIICVLSCQSTYFDLFKMTIPSLNVVVIETAH